MIWVMLSFPHHAQRPESRALRVGMPLGGIVREQESRGSRGYNTCHWRLLVVYFSIMTRSSMSRFVYGKRDPGRAVSKGLGILQEVVNLVPGHLGARLSMARAFYSTGQADLAHQTLRVRRLPGQRCMLPVHADGAYDGKCVRWWGVA